MYCKGYIKSVYGCFLMQEWQIVRLDSLYDHLGYLLHSSLSKAS